MKWTLLVWPGRRNTFWNPSRRLAGRWAAAETRGWSTYSSAISFPAAGPLLVTPALTSIVSFALGLVSFTWRFEKLNPV